MKKLIGIAILGVIIAVSAGLVPAAIDGVGSLFPKSFSDEDVASLERQIANHFREKIESDVGEVEEVSLIKKSPRELTGFVKIKVTSLGGTTINQRCTADMASDTGRIIWQCGR